MFENHLKALTLTINENGVDTYIDIKRPSLTFPVRDLIRLSEYDTEPFLDSFRVVL